MDFWITSMNRKQHQRAINKLVRTINKSIEKDELWQGRFQIHQVHSPEWHFYKDHSGADLWVCLRFVDRCSGLASEQWGSVNYWRGVRANGNRVWLFLNDFIVKYCNVWAEPLANDRVAWVEYNRTCRKNEV